MAGMALDVPPNSALESTDTTLSPPSLSPSLSLPLPPCALLSPGLAPLLSKSRGDDGGAS